MADPKFEKCDDGTYRITNGEMTVAISPEAFEDCYFAVPQEGDFMSPSYFYRLLTDSCVSTDEERLQIRKMVEESDLGKNAALESLQKDIRAMPEPS